MSQWSLGDLGLTLATGGGYGIYKGINDANNDNNDKSDASQAAYQQSLDLYNKNLTSQAKTDAAAKKQQYYGTSLDNLGGESQDYVNQLKNNLGKNVAKADQYNQQQGAARGLDNARAGLSGVDTSAMNEQSRRNASFGAAGINEDAQRQALNLYGNSISNRIEGANQIDNSQSALAIAQMKQPETQYNPGLVRSLFSGFF